MFAWTQKQLVKGVVASTLNKARAEGNDAGIDAESVKEHPSRDDQGLHPRQDL